jgi:hypothetical protein
MDEMRMIQNLLDEAPPSAEVVAEGRRRLTARPRRGRWPLWGGLAVVGAAAAVTLAVALTGGPVRTVGPEPVRPMTARQVLLTAADKAAAAPVGRYWHTHVISSEGYHIAAGDYMIFGARMEIDQWLARSDKVSDVFRSRLAGATPQTPADRAAWRRAGSPAHWRVISNGAPIPQSVRPEAWETRTLSPARKRLEKRYEADEARRCATIPKACSSVPLGPERREALAHDPQALRRYLLQTAGKGGSGYLLNVVGGFLLDPSSPELRAAVFRVLAGEPGVHNLGTTRDSLGRPAIVLAGRTTQKADVYDNELLLDPSTYAPLGVQTVLVRGDGGRHIRPGAIVHSELYLAMGWTNTAYRG